MLCLISDLVICGTVRGILPLQDIMNTEVFSNKLPSNPATEQNFKLLQFVETFHGL
jgi:hypothetical protein